MGRCRGNHLYQTALLVTPSGATVGAGATEQYAAVALMCNGTTQPTTVNWSASGGTIDANGLFTAGVTSGSFSVTAVTLDGKFSASVPVTVNGAAPTLTSITVFDTPTTVVAGRQVTFGDFGTLSDGNHNQPAVVWTTDAPGATISSTGAASALFTAGSTVGTFHVFATSGSIVGTAIVQVIAAPVLSSIKVTPNPATVAAGGTQQFSHTDLLSDGTPTSVTVVWSASGGTITQGGLFTAGATAGTFSVVATNGSVSGSATVTVTVAAPAAPTAVIKSPVAGFSVLAGTIVTLDPTGSFSVGASNPWYTKWVIKNSSNVVVASFTGTIGSLAANIFQWTPSVVDTYTITLTIVDSFNTSSSAASVSGTVTTSAATLQSLMVTPASFTLAAGQSQQYSVIGTNTNGTQVSNPSVTWTCTGGSITTGGLFIAGSTPGTYSVKATSTVNTAISNTATVTVSNPVISISVSPTNPTVNAGGQVQFTATGHRQDGTTVAVSASWTAVGGTISGSGLFTAGSVAVAGSVTATYLGLTATTSVTVSVISSGGYTPNLPGNYTIFARNPCAGVSGAGVLGSWAQSNPFNVGGVGFTTDPMDTVSPPSVYQDVMYTGMVPGIGSGAKFQGWGSPAQAMREYYHRVTFTLKETQYYCGGVTPLTKIWFINYGGDAGPGGNSGVVGIRHDEGWPYVVNGYLQGGCQIIMFQQGNVARRLYPGNSGGGTGVGSAGLDPKICKFGDVQNIIEMISVLNTLGSANGIFKMWVNGTMTYDYHDVVWITSGATNHFNGFTQGQTWGGSGAGTKPGPEHFEHGDIVLAGIAG